MPRVNYVKRTRKDQGQCGKCRIEIKKGDPYRFWKFRYGGKRIRCMKPECAPKQSDLTQSKMSGVYAAIEAAEEGLHDWDGEVDTMESIMSACAEEIRAVAEEYEESASNIEDGFGHETQMSEELREKGEELSSFADDIENFDCDSFAEEGAKSDAEDEIRTDNGLDDDADLDEYKDEIEEKVEEAREEWKTTIIDEANDILQQLPE